MRQSSRLFLVVGVAGLVITGIASLFNSYPEHVKAPTEAEDAEHQAQTSPPVPASVRTTAARAGSDQPNATSADASDADIEYGLADEAIPDGTLVGDNPQYPTLEMRLHEMQARRDGRTFDPQLVLAALKEPSAWTADDSTAEGLPVTDDERYDGRTFIRFNPLKVESLMPGDVMDVPIQQANATYQMKVDRVESYGDGTVTWYGKLQDFEGENQVSITQSQGLTYASVITPEEPYVVQVHGEAGWVVSSGTLFKGEEEPIVITSAGEPAVHAPHEPHHPSPEEPHH